MVKLPVGGVGIKNVKDSIILTDTEVIRFDEDIMVEGYVKENRNFGIVQRIN